MMKLWLLKPQQSNYDETNRYTKSSPWCNHYDCAHGFIVCAETEEQARELAAEEAGDEGKDAWLDSVHSFCEELTVDIFPDTVIMRDFLSG